MTTWTRILLLLAGVLALSGFRPAAVTAQTGFVVLAPDRGFLGNEETRDAFAAFEASVPDAVLAFATAEQTEENLREALAELEQRVEGVNEVVVLPLFLSDHNALYRKARTALEGIEPGIRFAPVLGRSYLAEEILFDRMTALLAEAPAAPQPAAQTQHQAAGHSAGGHGAHGGHGTAAPGRGQLVLVASGAATAADEAGIRADLEPLLRRTVDQFGLAGGQVAVIYDWSAPDSSQDAAFARSMASIEAAAGHGQVFVVPFNFSRLLTNMMSDWAPMHRRLAAIPTAVYDGEGVLPHPNVARWLTRSANGYLPLAQDEIGVIFVPHGSDYNWNEAMRDALAPLREEYVTADAFSMVDSEVVERAVRQLEDQGMKAAVMVRIFSLESSFKEQAEYVLGLRPEKPAGGHPGHAAERIESHLRFATAGGLEAHPYLAEGMLARVREISENPAAETVILVAHGTGDDQENAHWMDNMARIAGYIEDQSGGAFRDVQYFTWREDWPEKREAAVRDVRAAVTEASQDGGTALVVPVRTIDQGPEAKYLEGLTYRHGTGFAPHPKFVEWVEAVIQEGVSMLQEPDAELVSTAPGR